MAAGLLLNTDIKTQEDLQRAINLLRESGALDPDFRACQLTILLEDALPLDDQTLGEARSLMSENAVATPGIGQRVVLRGTFQRAEARNANGRIYPLSLLTREVERLQPFIKNRQLLGELDHPQSAKIRIPFASHVVTALWVEGNEIMGELEPLTTSYGNELRALIRDRVKLGVSSRGTGNLKNEGRGLIVQDNYRMLTFDIVSDPSTQGAYPAPVTEGAIGVCIGCGKCGGKCASKHQHQKTTVYEDITETANAERVLRYLRDQAKRLL